jgi:adenosylmethionine-8-amino-7-oxononanoate aminotransferase
MGMHGMFRGLLTEHHVIDLPQDEESAAGLARFLERHADELAGIIVEPLVQGAGGMRFHDAPVLRRLREAADRYELLLIFDEIFTGFGRTGTLFAYEAADIVPDIVTLSKALTGGALPLAATVARTRVFNEFWSDDPMHARIRSPAPPLTPRLICLSPSRACNRSPPLQARWSAAWRPAGTCPWSKGCA